MVHSMISISDLTQIIQEGQNLPKIDTTIDLDTLVQIRDESYAWESEFKNSILGKHRQEYKEFINRKVSTPFIIEVCQNLLDIYNWRLEVRNQELLRRSIKSKQTNHEYWDWFNQYKRLVGKAKSINVPMYEIANVEAITTGNSFAEAQENIWSLKKIVKESSLLSDYNDIKKYFDIIQDLETDDKLIITLRDQLKLVINIKKLLDSKKDNHMSIDEIEALYQNSLNLSKNLQDINEIKWLHKIRDSVWILDSEIDKIYEEVTDNDKLDTNTLNLKIGKMEHIIDKLKTKCKVKSKHTEAIDWLKKSVEWCETIIQVMIEHTCKEIKYDTLDKRFILKVFWENDNNVFDKVSTVQYDSDIINTATSQKLIDCINIWNVVQKIKSLDQNHNLKQYLEVGPYLSGCEFDFYMQNMQEDISHIYEIIKGINDVYKVLRNATNYLKDFVWSFGVIKSQIEYKEFDWEGIDNLKNDLKAKFIMIDELSKLDTLKYLIQQTRLVKTILDLKNVLSSSSVQNIDSKQDMAMEFQKFKEYRDVINSFLNNLVKIVGKSKRDNYLIFLEENEFNQTLSYLRNTIDMYDELIPDSQYLFRCLKNLQTSFENYTNGGIYDQNKNYYLFYKSKELLFEVEQKKEFENEINELQMIKWYSQVERFVWSSDWVSKKLVNQLKMSQPILYYTKLSWFAEKIIRAFRLYFNTLNEDMSSFWNEPEEKQRNNKINLDAQLEIYQIDSLKNSICQKGKVALDNISFNTLRHLKDHIQNELNVLDQEYWRESSKNNKFGFVKDLVNNLYKKAEGLDEKVSEILQSDLRKGVSIQILNKILKDYNLIKDHVRIESLEILIQIVQSSQFLYNLSMEWQGFQARMSIPEIRIEEKEMECQKRMWEQQISLLSNNSISQSLSKLELEYLLKISQLSQVDEKLWKKLNDYINEYKNYRDKNQKRNGNSYIREDQQEIANE